MLIACCALLLVGCSRRWYRQQADEDANCLIQQKGGHLHGGSVYVASDSRMYDPFSIDRSPMPPDDPKSHQYMHCVDGMHGWKHWHRNGDVSSIESPYWLASLPKDETGNVVLNLRDAVGVARINSRDYQQNVETLYRSALNVSFERFRFDHQFFSGTRTFEEFRGTDVGASSVLTQTSFGSVRKLSATGGELVVGFANSLVWDFWGSDSDLFTSTIDFSLVQPLLRYGGRARVLEQLTQSERNLLANVRQMQQYRQGFYVDIVTGRNSGPGPSLATNVGQAGLGLIAGVPSGRSGAADAGGYMGLLQDQQQIRNQATNITALRDSLAQLEAAFEANRINSRLQVDQARQALLNAQSSLLAAKAAYQTRVDSFKVDLGLPPTLPVEIRDELLDRFTLIDPKLTEIQDELAEILLEIRSKRENPTEESLETARGKIVALNAGIDPQLEAALSDLASLEKHLPERRKQLRQVKMQIDELHADVDSRVYDEQVLMKRIAFLQKRLPTIARDLNQLREEYTQSQQLALRAADGDDPDSPAEPTLQEQWKALNDRAGRLSDLLLELSLVHAETRLQGITLLPLEIEPFEALSYARTNRLDWMNARANLVDVWRKIEFFANALQSDLDVVVNGELGTDPDNIVQFTPDRSRIRFGVQFDTPTARLVERNQYREALLNYQQARRNYMLFEDRVSLSLRNTLRIAALSRINLEVRRTAVQVAIAQVDIARLKLNPPLRPNQQSTTSPTAARDLVSALSDLLDAQNDFLNVWVNYEVLRVLLDFEMGTMQLDPTGVWIDPGPIEAPTDAALADDTALLENGDVAPVVGGLPERLPMPATAPANQINSAEPLRVPEP
ncbi:TolC family protein [Rosistilla oblonga]|uniref:TolC family protein n=1 Tax=Rosistilla oblonga TaxID=2527990 RepID=UPI0018D26A32|nr:TolC family protein [Rosistilla oblonga]